MPFSPFVEFEFAQMIAPNWGKTQAQFKATCA